MEEKPFRILELFIESAGQVVKRTTLCEKLWPETYVGFDHSLNTAVNKLRSVLGDSAQSPRFIETRPRLGYRFVALVEWQNGDRTPVALRTASGLAEPQDNVPEPRPRRLVTVSSVRHSSRPQQSRSRSSSRPGYGQELSQEGKLVAE